MCTFGSTFCTSPTRTPLWPKSWVGSLESEDKSSVTVPVKGSTGQDGNYRKRVGPEGVRTVDVGVGYIDGRQVGGGVTSSVEIDIREVGTPLSFPKGHLTRRLNTLTYRTSGKFRRSLWRLWSEEEDTRMIRNSGTVSDPVLKDPVYPSELFLVFIYNLLTYLHGRLFY